MNHIMHDGSGGKGITKWKLRMRKWQSNKSYDDNNNFQLECSSYASENGDIIDECLKMNMKKRESE